MDLGEWREWTRRAFHLRRRLSVREQILVEADERYCELIARRMSQGILIEPDGAA